MWLTSVKLLFQVLFKVSAFTREIQVLDVHRNRQAQVLLHIKQRAASSSETTVIGKCIETNFIALLKIGTLNYSQEGNYSIFSKQLTRQLQ